MDLIFEVNKQTLLRKDEEKPTEKSQEYLKCKFEFSKDWEGTNKYAVFSNPNNDREVEIINNECNVPYEVIVYPFFTISVKGISNDNIVLITTNEEYISLQKTGKNNGTIINHPNESYENKIQNSFSNGLLNYNESNGLLTLKLVRNNGEILNLEEELKLKETIIYVNELPTNILDIQNSIYGISKNHYELYMGKTNLHQTANVPVVIVKEESEIDTSYNHIAYIEKTDTPYIVSEGNYINLGSEYIYNGVFDDTSSFTNESQYYMLRLPSTTSYHIYRNNKWYKLIDDNNAYENVVTLKGNNQVIKRGENEETQYYIGTEFAFSSQQTENKSFEHFNIETQEWETKNSTNPSIDIGVGMNENGFNNNEIAINVKDDNNGNNRIVITPIETDFINGKLKYNHKEVATEEYAKSMINDSINNVNTNITKLNNELGSLDNLTTNDKTNVVSAINEVNSKVNNNVSDINELKEELDAINCEKNSYKSIGTIKDNYFFRGNGIELSNSYAMYAKAEVTSNTEYLISGVTFSQTSNIPCVVFLDSSNNVIGTAFATGEKVLHTNETVITPNNCKYIIVNGHRYGYDASIYPSIFEIIKTNINVTDLENSKQNRLYTWKDVSKYYDGYRASINASIVSTSQTNYYWLAECDYDCNNVYRINGTCKASHMPIVICADSDNRVIKTYISTVDETVKEYILTDVPYNTKKLYVNGNTSGYRGRIEVREERNLESFEAKKIGVCFGDSITAGNGVLITNTLPPIDDYPTILEKKLGCTVYNGGIGGSGFSIGRGIDFVAIVDAIVSGIWDTVDTAMVQETSVDKQKIEKIKNLNFNNVDFITISYGTNDWNFGKNLDNNDNKLDTNTILGALRYCIKNLLINYPHLRIYIFTPIFRYLLGTDNAENSDTYANPTSNLLLKDVCEGIIGASKELHIPCKNMYDNSNMNEFTTSLYYSDGTHLNKKGYAVLGDIYAKFINSN